MNDERRRKKFGIGRPLGLAAVPKGRFPNVKTRPSGTAAKRQINTLGIHLVSRHRGMISVGTPCRV
jgi:hypothetical protein